MVYAVVDIETTGLSKNYHKITEIAALHIGDDGSVKKEFHTLVNPQTPIPGFITRLTGINNAMVKDAPTISEVIPKFVKFSDNKIFVAHNATFDYGFLAAAAQANELELRTQTLCTKKLANRLLPQLPSKRLDALCTHFNITNEAHHRAMGDARATSLVLSNFLTMLKEKGIADREEILRFEKRPVQKV